MIGNLALKTLTEPYVSVPWSTGIESLDRKTDLSLHRVPHPEDPLFTELVITPFQRAAWEDLWSIKMITREQPGILARIATFLRERRINILSMTSGTLNQARFHATTLLVDCSKYNGADGTHAERRSKPTASLNRLERELATEFIYDLRFFDPTYPSLTIDRSLPLWRQNQDILLSEQQPASRKVTLDAGRVQIPAGEFQRNRRSYASIFAVEPDALGPPEALISVSDNLELVRIFLFFRNLAIVPLVVSFDNQPGAIAALADRLSRRKVNVLASRAFTTGSYSRNALWMLVRDHSQADFPVSDRKVQKRIQGMLKRDEELEAFDPEFLSID